MVLVRARRSYDLALTLRRPEYRDPLLQHLGTRKKKSLLVLDEAHTAALSTASKYAIDSRITTVVRDIATKFENRPFPSATPYNGHSNSFSVDRDGMILVRPRIATDRTRND